MANDISSDIEIRLIRVLDSLENSLVNLDNRTNKVSDTFGQSLPNLNGFMYALNTGVSGLTRLVNASDRVSQTFQRLYSTLNDPARTTLGSSNKLLNTENLFKGVLGGPSPASGMLRGLGSHSGSGVGVTGPGSFWGNIPGPVQSMFDAMIHYGGPKRTSTDLFSSDFSTRSKTVSTEGEKAAARIAMASSEQSAMAEKAAGSFSILIAAVDIAAQGFFKLASTGSPDALVTLTESFDLLFAVVGSKLTPILAEGAGVVQKFVKLIQKLDPIFDDAIMNFLPLVGIIKVIIPAASALASALNSVIGPLNDFARFLSDSTGVGQSWSKKDEGSLNPISRLANGIAPLFHSQDKSEWWKMLSAEEKGGKPVDKSKLNWFEQFDYLMEKNILIPLRGIPGEKKDDPLSLGFSNKAGGQFVALDQVWKSVQSDLLRGDDLQRQILNEQIKSREYLGEIAGHSGKAPPQKPMVR